MTFSLTLPETETAIYLCTEDGTLVPKLVSQRACSVARIMSLRGQQGISERNTWAWCPDLLQAIQELRDAGLFIEERLVVEGWKPRGIFILLSKISLREPK